MYVQKCVASSASWKAFCYCVDMAVFTSLSRFETLWFSLYQHWTILVCLPQRTFSALPFSSHCLPKTLARSGAERLNGWRWKVCAPISALPSVVSSVDKNKRVAQMQISHHCDACHHWNGGRLYMNQKMCYLMEGFLNSRPIFTAITQQASSQVSNICPGNVPRTER